MTRRKYVEARLATLNSYRAKADLFPLCLDYQREYGYCFENHTGTMRLSQRLSLGEAEAFVNGALMTYEHGEKFAAVY